MQLGTNHTDKQDFLAAYPYARMEAFKSDNIRNGFAATGFVPFNPSQVLSQLYIQHKNNLHHLAADIAICSLIGCQRRLILSNCSHMGLWYCADLINCTHVISILPASDSIGFCLPPESLGLHGELELQL